MTEETNNNNNLIPVKDGQIGKRDCLIVDARQLHEFLEIETKFTDWITRRIEEYEFIENKDFLVSQNWETKKSGRGGNRKAVVDYQLSLNMAKELSMVERNHKGREVRKYFIECEERLLNNPHTQKSEARIEIAPEHKIEEVREKARERVWYWTIRKREDVLAVTKAATSEALWEITVEIKESLRKELAETIIKKYTKYEMVSMPEVLKYIGNWKPKYMLNQDI